ncbi:prolyl oligopeptidase, putative [Trypanosoma brucei gambiense DAL972]|uniref:Prolyl endopeptidase n=2 Tax=Trypanosoma brucei TaxID=5691 RepID=D0A3P6_TRYB9|nr:prolyl oligopeptidase, putative [Trypanosoma brucei gambiense DAL972]CAD42967.1 prolyl oligopeptidase [Trypanosoma brucei]CBH15890.1 prolyl oligopeptidase, putative [Trypanosoma brucei gambiense DAL972]|eukprot:XP_011778154.1 prolyl oligopeptidase, putative [Trypanosoma brucei gambiense DAL972]
MRLAYPTARRSAASYVLHNVTVPEPYDYLEDPENNETKSFVKAQNDLFGEYMRSTEALGNKLYNRISQTFDFPRTSNPSFRNGRYYFYHNTGLQNQSVLKRATSLTDSNPTTFLDPNILSNDGTTALKATAWSEDESLFAYSASDKGSDWQHIHVRRADTAEDTEDVIEWAKFTGISWLHNTGFFYTRFPALKGDVDKGAETDAAKDPFVCFHRLGTKQDEDAVVLSLPEHPHWGVSAEVSNCHSYLVVSITDGCEPKNLIWITKLPIDGAEKLSPSTLTYNKLFNEFVGSFEYLGNDGTTFYFVTTRDAPRKKIISVDIATGKEQIVVGEREAVLDHAALVKNTLILVYLEDVKSTLYYCCLDKPELKKITIPIGAISSLFADRKVDLVSFKVTSFLLPGRSFVLDINDPEGSLRVFKDDNIEGLSADDFITEQKFYNSADGTRIPMFIIHRKGIVTSESPVLLYGYGGFNISLTPSFSSSRVVFLQHLRGVLAVPNIRGGGEYGEAWHNAGRLTSKQNCFTDFIEAAKFLHGNGYGNPATTAIMGGSNGGLLVAAVANQAPELFRCVICQVGVLDMYKFHKFTIGHAWRSDFGDPDKEEDFKVLQKYSPLHNIKSGVKYPAILVVTGDHDDRVVPLHSLKYIAALQHENPTEGGPFLARVEVAAGHGAGKPTSKIMQESADIYTFIAKNTNAQWTD